jgi:hypothetical protein
LEAEKEEARRLEEKRRQEQERNERQHRQQNNQSYLFKIFGFLALIIGGVILVVIITEHGSLSINELMLVIALLIMGIIFLCAKIME